MDGSELTTPISSLPPPVVRVPLRHHQLARLTPGWWRPLVTLLLALGLYVAFTVAGLIALTVVAAAVPRLSDRLDRALDAEDASLADPLSLGVVLAMLALAVPACRWAVRIMHRPGSLDSVELRLRWGLLARALPVAAAVPGTATIVCSLVWPTPVHPRPDALVMAVLVVLLVPLQAAGEEYVFRGLLPQVVGAWLRSPLWGVVVSVPLFVAGHAYDAAGLVAVASYAMGASYLVWCTGGLEVAIAWHTVNNLIAFTEDALGMVDPDAPVTWLAAGLDVAITAVTVALFEACWRRSWSHRYRAVR